MMVTINQEKGARPMFMCDLCAIRQRTAHDPDSLMGSFWRLHTRVCPMWNSYRVETEVENPEIKQQDVLVLLALLSGILAGAGILIGLLTRKSTSDPADV